MLRVVTGPFQPHLETALVETIRAAKTSDSFAPLALIAPATEILTRVRQLLVRDARLSLLNVHFLTFHQLALRLWDEARQRNHASDPPAPPQLVDDLFFEELVRHLSRHHLQQIEPLQALSQSSGLWGALWSTLRDLREAAVDPMVGLRALSESVFDAQDGPWLEALFTMHSAMAEAGKSLGVWSPDDLAAAVTATTPQSRFLARMTQVYYYGFYDLSQVQLSCFEQVAKTAPTTLFFPLDAQPGYAFARRFFEQYVAPLAPAEQPIRAVPTSPTRSAPAGERHPLLRIGNVVGPEEELALTCREILTLVETNGYRFEDIGVVARTLDPYYAALSRVFERHLVPFTSSLGRPLVDEPLTKTILQLASLVLTDFPASSVLDILTSPFYRTDLAGVAVEELRPDLWKVIVRSLNVTRGRRGWERVRQLGAIPLRVEIGDDETESTDATVGIAPGHLQTLWQLVSQLILDCERLPQQGTAAELTDAFVALVSRHLSASGVVQETAGDAFADRENGAGSAIAQTMQRIRALDFIGHDLTWEEWTRLLMRTIERTTIPIESIDHHGVRVMDAMEARGWGFQALFILGLNEKVFPRYIREDAFLRDRQRRILADTLGYKIDEKLAGYEEERLLFTLLCHAAQSRLYLFYQRADLEGRALVPSPFLDEARDSGRFQIHDEVTIPRRLTDRIAQQPAMYSLLPRPDLGLWLILNQQDPTPLLESLGGDAAAFRHGRETLDLLDADGVSLSAYDGMTGTITPFWTSFVERGAAPTPLETYARCPFQYFARHVLQLAPLREPNPEQIEARDLGLLCHDALQRCYRRLTAQGWPAHELAEATIAEITRLSVQEALAHHAIHHGIGYPLLWEITRTTVEHLVRQCVAVDSLDYRENGYRPSAFEVEAEGTLEQFGGAPRPALKIRGQVDRVDRHRDAGTVRIVDYKFKPGSMMRPEDRDLTRAAIRGARLQPPLYLRLVIPDHPPPTTVEFRYLAPQWNQPISRSTFDASFWQSAAAAQLTRTLATLLDGIQAGQFFILPGDYCAHCAFSTICRRLHEPTWLRAVRAPRARALRLLRKAKVADE